MKIKTSQTLVLDLYGIQSWAMWTSCWHFNLMPGYPTPIYLNFDDLILAITVNRAHNAQHVFLSRYLSRPT